MRKFDLDGSGTLDWLEFLSLWRSGPEFFRFEVCGDLSEDVLAVAEERVSAEAAVWTARLEVMYRTETEAIPEEVPDPTGLEARPVAPPVPMSPLTRRYQVYSGDWRDTVPLVTTTP
jgi:hypothetical protein